MKIKKPTLLTTFISLALITCSILYAASSTKSMEEQKQTPSPSPYYKCMNTHDLQEVVEKLSTEGKLPFEMGLELMKRWQREKPNI